MGGWILMPRVFPSIGPLGRGTYHQLTSPSANKTTSESLSLWEEKYLLPRRRMVNILRARRNRNLSSGYPKSLVTNIINKLRQQQQQQWQKVSEISLESLLLQLPQQTVCFSS